jgi:flagellar basal-body rod modification protein FlgD
MINSLPVNTPLAPVATQIAESSKTEGLDSDFKTFLKMLTAQARYQDPLKPIDSTQYASQLAQFSMVEQQVKTNDALTAMFGQLGGSNIASLANWVGMDARAAAPAYFDGSPVFVSPNPPSVADRVQMVVMDGTGTEVQRLNIPVSSDPIEWAGVNGDGEPFAKGLYSFSIESYKGDDLVLSETAEVYGNVSEAQIQNGQVVLILEGGQAILSSSVTGLRNVI